MESTKQSDFASDPRMKLNEQTGKWSYVGDDEVSYEYDENVGAWFPMVKKKYTHTYSLLLFINLLTKSTTKNLWKPKLLYTQYQVLKKT